MSLLFDGIVVSGSTLKTSYSYVFRQRGSGPFLTLAKGEKTSRWYTITWLFKFWS